MVRGLLEDLQAKARAMIEIEVVCALPMRNRIVRLAVPAGTTLRQAVERSAILRDFPELDPARCRYGVFGELRDPDAPLAPGERVEIYRPLSADPRQARRRRVRSR
jgi:putative ubiquitin-RnfH superfamily antitoxin RatB of RatAB toxin-antitoxin module